MINTSNEYDNRITENRVFVLNANVTLADSTVLSLDDTDIIQGGMEFEDETSGTSSFQIGTAIINKHTLTLQNYDGKFDEYEFTDAVVRPRVGLQLSETVESLNKGVFTVDEPSFTGSVIILECLDNMHKFERAFSEVSLGFPTTAGNALQVISIHCGVSLATTTFFNSSYIIQSRPDDEALSCLDMVSYIAQVAGDYARCNTAGSLELKWYDLTVFENETNLDGGYFDDSNPYASGDNADGGNFTDYNSGDSFDGGTFLDLKKFWHFYDFGSTPTIGIDDVVITGIKVENTDSENGFSAIYGTEGYVISIMNNPLVQSQANAQQIANTVGAKIVGMKFRQFSASILSNPAIEAGDPAKLSVRARDGFNVYCGYVTNLSYRVGSRESVRNSAESVSRNSSTRYSEQTKTIVQSRKNTKQQLTAYDIAVQQLTSIMTNAMGYYPIRVTQPDGSYIDYMCDKPSLAESQIIWKKSIDGFAVSKDGGTTWITGITADGNIVAQTLSVVGINADWINAGSITSQNGHSTINLNNGTFSLGNARLVWNGTKLSVVGEITANSGKIGPFDISNAGLMSDIMQFFENENQPLIWLTKKGPEGESWESGADGVQRSNYEPAVAAVRAVEDGIETDVYIQARDNLQGDFGVFEIDRFEVSSGMPVSRVKATEDGISFEKYSGGFIEKSFEINLNAGNILMESNGKSFLISFDDSEGTLYIQADKVVINGHEF